MRKAARVVCHRPFRKRISMIDSSENDRSRYNSREIVTESVRFRCPVVIMFSFEYRPAFCYNRPSMV